MKALLQLKTHYENTSNLWLLLVRLLLISLAFLLLVYSGFSIWWRMEHDIPLLNYAAFLINEHDFVIYKNIFETSMPGTFVFHIFYTKLFGYSDFGYRFCDILLLTISAFGIYMLFKRTDKDTAIFACITWGICYLNFGETVGLQKDYVGLIPLIFASVLLMAENKTNPYFFFIGVLLACSFWVKPHLLAWFFPAFVYIYWWRKERLSFKQLFLFLSGFAAISLLIVSWLYSVGCLSEWLDLFFNYTPLHVQLNGTHEVIPGWPEKIKYRVYELLDVFMYYPSNLLYIAAFIWVFIKRDCFPQKNLVRFLLLSNVVFYLYPAVSGQFWIYHWVPFFFFSIMVMALIFYLARTQKKPTVPASLLMVFVLLQIQGAYYQITPNSSPKNGVVDGLATWIETNTLAGETIQPLDWSAGSIHAMLMTERIIATKFFYDYHFYHHVSEKKIQELRNTFIDEIKSGKPSYFFDMHRKPLVSGFDTTEEFQQLEDILQKEYTIVLSNSDYTIYKVNSQ